MGACSRQPSAPSRAAVLSGIARSRSPSTTTTASGPSPVRPAPRRRPSSRCSSCSRCRTIGGGLDGPLRGLPYDPLRPHRPPAPSAGGRCLSGARLGFGTLGARTALDGNIARMDIPYFDLKGQYGSIREEILAALDRVCRDASFIVGAEVGEFEREFAAYCEVKHCVAVNSGTSALHLALLAAGVGSGDEVITTSNTFIATAEAISYTGARPVFVDIDPATANIDPERIEAAITSRTKAILPVYLYGRPADLDAVLKIAESRGLPVIEDACQAHGARWRACTGSDSPARAWASRKTIPAGRVSTISSWCTWMGETRCERPSRTEACRPRSITPCPCTCKRPTSGSATSRGASRTPSGP